MTVTTVSHACMTLTPTRIEIFHPSDLAYGDSGRPPKIGGGDCLIFTMEIVKIKGDSVPKKEL